MQDEIKKLLNDFAELRKRLEALDRELEQIRKLRRER